MNSPERSKRVTNDLQAAELITRGLVEGISPEERLDLEEFLESSAASRSFQSLCQAIDQCGRQAGRTDEDSAQSLEQSTLLSGVARERLKRAVQIGLNSLRDGEQRCVAESEDEYQKNTQRKQDNQDND